MKKLLNTMYITTQGGYLFRDGESLVVRLDGSEKIRFPLLNLEGVVCFGEVSVSSPLLALCAERGVGFSFLSEQGRFLARSAGRVSGSVLLRRTQYRNADNPAFSAKLARTIIAAKIYNSRVTLLRARRESESGSYFDLAIENLKTILRAIEPIEDIDVLRGKEGEAAKVYFAVFNGLILAQKEDFSFHERSRRPPLDNINAMLSFIYTLLTHDLVSALESNGLDPAVGFLHRDRPGRPSLALDLVEELRSYIADRLVLSLINRKQVQGKGFKITESGAVEMNDATKKVLITAYQEKKREEIVHPFLKEKIPVGLIPYVQAMLLARYMRGDLDGYPPFLCK